MKSVLDASQLASIRLGQTLRRLRFERGSTLEEVARGTNISASFLSLVENAKSDIAFARLSRLALFYGASVSDLVVDEPPTRRRIVLSNEAREVPASPGSGVHFFVLSHDPQHRLEPFRVIMEAGARTDAPMMHDGEEFLHLITGRVRVSLGTGEEYILSPGDTVYFPSHIPHALENLDDSTSTIVGAATHRP